MGNRAIPSYGVGDRPNDAQASATNSTFKLILKFGIPEKRQKQLCSVNRAWAYPC